MKTFTHPFMKIVGVILLLVTTSIACQLNKSVPPVITIVRPDDGSTFIVNQPVEVETVSVSQDGIARVELRVNGEQIDTADGGGEQSFSTVQTWTPTAVGTFRLEVRAFDANNVQSNSATVTVAVGQPSAQVTVVVSTFTPESETSKGGVAVPTATPVPPPTATPTPAIPTLITKTDLNVRTGPSTDFDVVGVLFSGSSARIIGVNAERTWWLIAFSGAANGQGWASAGVQYGTAINTELVPVVASPPTPTPVLSPTPTPTVLPDFPRIHFFRADRLNITAGEIVLLQWDVSGADAIYLYPGGEGGVVAPGDMQVTPTMTTVYRLVAHNDRGDVEATVTINVTSVISTPQVVFDFVQKGPDASWENGSGVALPWNGTPNDPRGFVVLQENITLEDDSRPAQALETHPEWIMDGNISGSYDVDFEIKSGDRFVAEVGFLKGAASSNGVTFQFCYFTFIEGDCLAEVTKTYNQTIVPFEVDLSSLNGYNAGWFQLRVLANGNANQDWAVWVNPRIERP